MLTLTDHLEKWARTCPDRPLYTFLNRAGNSVESYTYASFHARTNGLARVLAGEIEVEPAEPVLVVYPPGLELIIAFMACVKAGAIPVPVPPPSTSGIAAASQRLTLIAKNSGAKLALTDQSIFAAISSQQGATDTTSAVIPRVHLLALDWIATNNLGESLDHFEDRSQPLLFLQYTSGSTQEPRGVMVSHENVIANSWGVGSYQHPIGVSWLPHFHDMGLIGYYLFPIIRGGSNFHFSPADFLRRPSLWLELIGRFGATETSAPNFAFEYCLRSEKISNDAIQKLNLSTLRVMMNASEPARPDIMERFLARFAVTGLSAQALSVAYGLAENTLCATLGGRAYMHINRRSLQRNKLRFVWDGRDHNTLAVASCGKPADGVEIKIVLPATSKVASTDQIGEVWLAGTSKALGYWTRPDLTAAVFKARLDGNCTEFLRTGDLGFMRDGELYVCGRLKDMIVVRGANIYPTDIEFLVDQSLGALHHGKVAVFGFGDRVEEDKGVVVLVELASATVVVDLRQLHRKLSKHLNLPILTLACVARHSIPCTSSGKIARHKCRDIWQSGAMKVFQRLDPAVLGADQPDLLSYLEGLLEQSGGNPNLPLSDLGLDSLELVQLTLEIERLITDNLGTGWLNDTMFDLRTLQSMTLGALKKMVDDIQARRINGFSAALFYQQTVQSVSERDALAMRADAVLPSEFLSKRANAIPITQQPAGTVLLTGATGFLGSHLLEALLRMNDCKIVVITRGRDIEHARQRVSAALTRAEGRAGDNTVSLSPRIEVLNGDLAMPRLGLTERAWTGLSERLCSVFHCGAEVDYVKTYADLRGPNVLGTREIIDLCYQGSPKILHHISTTFIFGWTPQLLASEDDFNASMRGLDFGYIQSKWVAERLITKARVQGIDARIYRPSLITASQHGNYVGEDILVRLLSYMIRHELSCDASNQLSLLPVDVCAQNIVSLASLDRPDAPTFHLTTDKYYTLQMACQCITERHGYPFEYVDIRAFIDHITQHCRPEDVLFPLVAFFRTNRHKIAVMSEKRYDNRNYQAARALLGHIAPEPELADVMDPVVEFLQREKLITPVGRDGMRKNPASGSNLTLGALAPAQNPA